VAQLQFIILWMPRHVRRALSLSLFFAPSSRSLSVLPYTGDLGSTEKKPTVVGSIRYFPLHLPTPKSINNLSLTTTPSLSLDTFPLPTQYILLPLEKSFCTIVRKLIERQQRTLATRFRARYSIYLFIFLFLSLSPH
jgi:hypothetical protein